MLCLKVVIRILKSDEELLAHKNSLKGFFVRSSVEVSFGKDG